MRKYYLWGYWEKNCGDDLFLASFINSFPDDDVVVLARKKYKSYYSNFGVSVICFDSLIYRFFNRISRLLFNTDLYFRLIKNSDFVMLGGSLFAENKTTEQEKRQCNNLLSAVNNACHSYVVGSNFGPYKTTGFYEFYHSLFAKIDDICFRDEKSFSLFSDLSNVRYAPDIVLEKQWVKKVGINTERQHKIVFSIIDLSRRNELSQYTVHYEKHISELSKYYLDLGFDVALLSFCEEEGDLIACERISDLVCSDKLRIVNFDSIDTMFYEIKTSERVYASRFHASILALCSGVEMISLVYGEKTVNALKSYCERFTWLPIEKIQEYCCEEMALLSGEYIFRDDFVVETGEHFKEIIAKRL